MTKNLLNLGYMLRLKRVELKLKSKQVAEFCEISADKYSKIESGRITPTKELCKKISLQLFIPEHKLLILAGLIPLDIQSKLNDLYDFFGEDVLSVIDDLLKKTI